MNSFRGDLSVISAKTVRSPGYTPTRICSKPSVLTGCYAPVKFFSIYFVLCMGYFLFGLFDVCLTKEPVRVKTYILVFRSPGYTPTRICNFDPVHICLILKVYNFRCDLSVISAKTVKLPRAYVVNPVF